MSYPAYAYLTLVVLEAPVTPPELVSNLADAVEATRYE